MAARVMGGVILLVSLLLSLKGSYESLECGWRNVSYTLLAKRDVVVYFINKVTRVPQTRMQAIFPLRGTRRQIHGGLCHGCHHVTFWFLSRCLSDGVTGA
jgi:hypothetical protein